MRHGLVELSFKVHRGLVAERAVEPRAVVKDFDPVKDRRAGLRSRGEVGAVDQSAFECAPKTFHRGIVVAVAFAAHAGNHAGKSQTLPVGGAGGLASIWWTALG